MSRKFQHGSSLDTPIPRQQTIPVETVTIPETSRQLETNTAGVRSAIALQLQRLWYDDPPAVAQTVLRTAFSFTGAIYRRLLLRRMCRARRNQVHLPAYVVSIGNLVVGGTGKTPFAIWLAQFYRGLGRRVAILSRGYGGSRRTAAKVPSTDSASSVAPEYGDEPALMALTMPEIPVWTGRRRATSGFAAIEQGDAELLVLDDGFQHLALYRDLDVVLLDSRNPFGNGRLIPTGPLREPIEHLQRADLIILTRADDFADSAATLDLINRHFPDKAVFRCRHYLSHCRWGLAGAEIPLTALRGRKFVAFTGIARPDSFFASLTDLHLHPAAQTAFPDHYVYRPTDLTALLNLLNRHGADFLLTTEKDAVRLPPDFRPLVLTVHLQLDFGPDRQPLMRYLAEHLHPFTALMAPAKN